MVDYTQNLTGDAPIDVCSMMDLYDVNIFTSKYIPKQGEKWTRELFVRFIEEYELKDYSADENQNIEILDGKENLILPKDKYRIKAANVLPLSLILYYNFEYFKPMLLPSRFNIIQSNVAVGSRLNQLIGRG